MTRKKQIIAKPVLAYTVAELAAAIGKGETLVREHIADGKLVAIYLDSYPTIPVAEAERWIATAPTEKPARRAS